MEIELGEARIFDSEHTEEQWSRRVHVLARKFVLRNGPAADASTESGRDNGGAIRLAGELRFRSSLEV